MQRIHQTERQSLVWPEIAEWVDAIYAVNDVRRRVGTLKTEDWVGERPGFSRPLCFLAIKYV